MEKRFIYFYSFLNCENNLCKYFVRYERLLRVLHPLEKRLSVNPSSLGNSLFEAPSPSEIRSSVGSIAPNLSIWEAQVQAPSKPEVSSGFIFCNFFNCSLPAKIQFVTYYPQVITHMYDLFYISFVNKLLLFGFRSTRIKIKVKQTKLSS